MNDPYRSYLQDIDYERITGFRSLDSDGSREVVNLREVEVLDIIGIVRIQYLQRVCRYQSESDVQTQDENLHFVRR